ncbi:MAG TPA: transglycosylase SLT domain-containing protein [Patescibacteria group bacterium]|nr:transglycosylase SLT domain-containing protein [Patescibacteria group bacterium]
MNDNAKSGLFCCLLPAILYIAIIVMLLAFLLSILSRSGGPCSGVKSFLFNVVLTGNSQEAKDALCGASKEAFGAPPDAAAGAYIYDGGNTSSCSSTGLINTSRYINDPNLPGWIKDASDKYFGGDQALLISIIQVESGWKPNAYNPSSATGLGQFLTSTAQNRKWVEFHGGTDPQGKTWPFGTIYTDKPPPSNDARFDPERSLYAGARYFSETMGYPDLQGFKDCKGATGIQLAYCAYIYHYNGGCYLKPGSSTYSATQKDLCTAAVKAGNEMKTNYANLTSKGQCVAIAGALADGPIGPLVSGKCSERIMSEAQKYIGIPYSQGKPTGSPNGHCGTNSNGREGVGSLGIDCSGFVSRVYRDSGIFPENKRGLWCNTTATLPGNSLLRRLSGPKELKTGDLIVSPGHVVIFISTNTDGSARIIESGGSDPGGGSVRITTRSKVKAFDIKRNVYLRAQACE